MRYYCVIICDLHLNIRAVLYNDHYGNESFNDMYLNNCIKLGPN